MANQFTINSVTVYTIKSAHGVIECQGWDKLKEHGENTLGAFVDRISLTGNHYKDKIAIFEHLKANREDLETIFAMMDQIAAMEPRSTVTHCYDDSCDCPDCHHNQD